MSLKVLIGTKKGLATLEAEAPGAPFASRFDMPGWSTTASTQGDDGAFFISVVHEAFGPTVLTGDGGGTWHQLPGAPRYAPETPGNPVHNTLIQVDLPWASHKGQQRHVDQIWALHYAHGRLFAGVSEAGLFVTEDGGKTWSGLDGLNHHPGRESWEPGAGGLCCHTILTDPADPGRIWAGISAAGFFRSDDGGKTFVAKNAGVNGDAGQCVHAVAHDPSAPDILFRQEHRGVYRSLDGGDSWDVIESGLPTCELGDGHVCSFGFPIVLERKSGAAFVVPMHSDGQRMPKDGRLSVYRSRDKGEHWEACTNGLPGSYFGGVLRGAMACDQGSVPGLYFGTTAGDVFASFDTGDTWTAIARGLPRILSVEAYVA